MPTYDRVEEARARSRQGCGRRSSIPRRSADHSPTHASLWDPGMTLCGRKAHLSCDDADSSTIHSTYYYY